MTGEPDRPEASAGTLARCTSRRLALSEVPDEAATSVVVVDASDVVGEFIDVLATFVEHLSLAVRAAGTGEVDGLSDEAEEQVIICYGADPHALRTFLERELEASPVPPRRVEIRTGR